MYKHRAPCILRLVPSNHHVLYGLEFRRDCIYDSHKSSKLVHRDQLRWVSPLREGFACIYPLRVPYESRERSMLRIDAILLTGEEDA